MALKPHRCRCCGARMAEYVAPREEIVARLETSNQVFLMVVQRLAWRPGNMVSYFELIDYCWSDDPTGGPDDPIRAIYNSIYTCNGYLNDLGWHVENHRGRWRLVTVDAAKEDDTSYVSDLRAVRARRAG